MRSLAQPRVLGRAALAALITSLACWPRLATWPGRSDTVMFLWLVLLWAMFMLWSFVFAWQFQYARRPAINLEFQPKLWTVATLGTATAAVLMHFLLDPQLRQWMPADYPANGNAWVAMSLFALGIGPLFLCFAPFAFFIRLARQQETALVLTVLFGVFVMALKLNSAKTPAPMWLIVELIALRLVTGFVSVYFYLKGGALLVWWVGFIVQLRYLLELAAGGNG